MEQKFFRLRFRDLRARSVGSFVAAELSSGGRQTLLVPVQPDRQRQTGRFALIASHSHSIYIYDRSSDRLQVQIRVWKLADADFVLDAAMPLDPRKTVFIGGVPRPLKAGTLPIGICHFLSFVENIFKHPLRTSKCHRNRQTRIC